MLLVDELIKIILPEVLMVTLTWQYIILIDTLLKADSLHHAWEYMIHCLTLTY